MNYTSTEWLKKTSAETPMERAKSIKDMAAGVHKIIGDTKVKLNWTDPDQGIVVVNSVMPFRPTPDDSNI